MLCSKWEQDITESYTESFQNSDIDLSCSHELKITTKAKEKEKN